MVGGFSALHVGVSNVTDAGSSPTANGTFTFHGDGIGTSLIDLSLRFAGAVSSGATLPGTATAGATAEIATGDRLTVDGFLGIVTVG